MEELKPDRCRPRAESLGDLVGEPPQAIDDIPSFVRYVRDTSREWHEEDRRDIDDDEERVLKAERIVGRVWTLATTLGARQSADRSGGGGGGESSLLGWLKKKPKKQAS